MCKLINHFIKRLLANPNLEIITVEIYYKITLTICLVYIPPNASVNQYACLFSYLEGLNTQDDVIMIGDFNLPDINWPSLCGHSAFSTLFCDLVFHHNLTQHVTTPTHIKRNTGVLYLKPTKL